jgi:hypothetical protein
MAKDPFDIPADRILAVLKYWKAGLAIAAILFVVAERNLFAADKDHLVNGEIVAIDRTGGTAHATVRLGEAQQAVVTLPNGTRCHQGSKIRLVRHDTVSRHDFRTADPPCAA